MQSQMTVEVKFMREHKDPEGYMKYLRSHC